MFILQKDFYEIYTEIAFKKLISNNSAIWGSNLKTVIEDVKGYLRNRYDVSKVFAPLNLFDLTETYAIDDRLYIDAETYSEKTYILNELTSFEDNIYYCNTPITAGEPFDVSKFTLIGTKDDIFTCTAESTGNYPTDTDYFSNIDSRNAKIVEIVCDIILYNLLNRLNSIDIPANRKERYDGNDGKQSGGAIGWLKSVSKGMIEPDLPLLETAQEDGTGNIVLHGNSSETIEKYTTI